MRMYSASGRSRWPYVIGAAVVVLAVGGGIAYANNRGDSTPTAISTRTSTPTTAPTSIPTGGDSGSGDNDDDAAPTGCLGGQDRDPAMVLAAQRAGKHTTYGAVEVATAFYRWLWQYPYPSQSEAKQVSAAVMSSSAPASFADVAAQYASVKNPTGGIVPDGKAFHVSTTNGIWQVGENSTSNRVSVNLAAGYVIDGALSPTQVAVAGYTMVWENGSWRIAAGINVDQTKLANGGTHYTGGC
jgi:hypothetical protein